MSMLEVFRYLMLMYVSIFPIKHSCLMSALLPIVQQIFSYIVMFDEGQTLKLIYTQ